MHFARCSTTGLWAIASVLPNNNDNEIRAPSAQHTQRLAFFFHQQPQKLPNGRIHCEIHSSVDWVNDEWNDSQPKQRGTPMKDGGPHVSLEERVARVCDLLKLACELVQSNARLKCCAPFG